MEKRQFIEAVASGLRRIDITPVCMLILVDKIQDFEWDEDTICAIPVIKSYVSVNSGYDGGDYPIIPCFKNIEESKIFMLVYNFQRGFGDKLPI